MSESLSWCNIQAWFSHSLGLFMPTASLKRFKTSWSNCFVCHLNCWYKFVMDMLFLKFLHCHFVTIERSLCTCSLQRINLETNAYSRKGQMENCCQDLPVGALSSRTAPSVLVGALLKKVSLFFLKHTSYTQNKRDMEYID